MPKIRRGNYVFVTWVGDHDPRHVHVYKDGELIVKWDLTNWRPLLGAAPRKVVEYLRDLVERGLL